jgi:hypothetical protein
MRIGRWRVKFRDGRNRAAQQYEAPRNRNAPFFGSHLRSGATKIRLMRRALVAGALGVTGRTLVHYLTSLGDWDVIGVSRREPDE